jgi:hypothetical protein
MEWQPQPQGLAVLLHLLRDASKPNNSDQALIQRVIFFFVYCLF